MAKLVQRGDHRQARPLVLAVPLVTPGRDTQRPPGQQAGQGVLLLKPRFYCHKKALIVEGWSRCSKHDAFSAPLQCSKRKSQVLGILLHSGLHSLMEVRLI